MMTMTVTEVIKFIIRSHVETVKTKITVEITKLLLESLTKSLIINVQLLSEITGRRKKGMFTN